MVDHVFTQGMKFIEKMIESKMVPANYRECFNNVQRVSGFSPTLASLGVNEDELVTRLEKCNKHYTQMTSTGKYIVLMMIRDIYFNKDMEEKVPNYERTFVPGLELFFTKGIASINDNRIINLARVMIAIDYVP